MRSGTCTVQQTLTAEAASILKHSLTLARRRGHAQVTPLHVAATLLTSRTSLLRRACLKSQPPHLHSSHPLQCRALELCFNVALNRLPTSTPSPLIQSQPSLSNALIAALKRAQAHQRRGCIEQQQQQPLLTVKVELEQLVVSILDDPSVSRVMREAGFSSTCVKNSIEECCSSSAVSSVFGVFSNPCSPNSYENPWQTHLLSYSPEKTPLFFSPQRRVLGSGLDSDVKLVLEVLLGNKRKNIVLVGDSVSVSEGVVGEIMRRFERGEVPLELRNVQFVKFQFAPVSLRFMKKEDVEMNVSQLKNKVESIEGGVIVYTGDLKWTVEEIGGGNEKGYSSVEHLVTEIGKTVAEFGNEKKVWLMGTASYQTYMRCQMRQPALEIQWGLQPLSVPSAGLALTLHASSNQESRIPLSKNSGEIKPIIIGKEKEDEEKLSCCPECTSSFDKEAQLFNSTYHKNLPPWLQPRCSNTNRKDELYQMKRKWNGICQSLNHQGQNSHFHGGNMAQSLTERTNAHSSTYPWWSDSSLSNSISFTESSALNPTSTPNSVPKFRRQQSCSTIHFSFSNGITQKQQTGQPNLDSLKNSSEEKELKITLGLGNSVLSDVEKKAKWRNDFSKFLQENVPWQSESTESIVDAFDESKSARKGTWLFIQGNDIVGKRRLALAIAEFVSGSTNLLVHLNLRKGGNDEEAESFSNTIERALRNQEKVVALIEDVDFGDTKFLNFLADAFRSGKFESMEPVLILTKGGDSLNHQDPVEVNPGRKRKTEWEILSKNKNARTENGEEEKEQENMEEAKKNKKDCFFNCKLDLNMKVDDEENEGEMSPISSDLTRETSSDKGMASVGILELLIKNKFVFNDGKKEDDLEG